jgi:hypothetical protein
MIEIGTKILDVVCLLFRLCTPGGAQGLVAEVLLLRQELLVLKKMPLNGPLAALRVLALGI